MDPSPEPPRTENHAPGFPTDLEGLLDIGEADLRIESDLLVKDYYLHKALHAVAASYPATGAIPATVGATATEVPGWAFAGGTSLVSGHRLVWRYSDDIDLVLFTEGLGRNPRERVCSQVRDLAVHAITGGDPDIAVTRTGGTVKTAEIAPPDIPLTVQIDVGPTTATPQRRTVGEARSLLARYADPDTLLAHPELRTTDVPLLAAEITAVNKLATLHGRAVHNDLDGLRARARDLYDLAALAAHPDLRRRIAAEIARRGSDAAAGNLPVASWWAAPRPTAGYAASVVFDPASAAYAALRQGYEGPILSRLLFADSRRLTFTDAISAAANLDDQRPRAGRR